jgi:methylated-DNA-[protein]-cysteine S-methyltransferase
MERLYKGYYSSPIGVIEITASEEAITSLKFTTEMGKNDESPLIKACVRQLDEYFKGKRREFDLPLAPAGTPYQSRVWRELDRIPYGMTTSYADIAVSIGNEKACRAVGNSIGRNPILILIPCHRAIGKDGSLTGYAGGLERKEWLLRHEMVCKKESHVVKLDNPIDRSPGI